MLAAGVYGGFLAQAGRRAMSSGRAVPRIGVVLVADRDDLADGVDWFRQALARCGAADGVCVDPVAAEVVSVTAELEGDLSLEDRSAPTARLVGGSGRVARRRRVDAGLPPGAPAARRWDPRRRGRRAAVRGVLGRRDDRPPAGPAGRLAARLDGGDTRGQCRGARPGHRRRRARADLHDRRGAHDPVGDAFAPGRRRSQRGWSARGSLSTRTRWSSWTPPLTVARRDGGASGPVDVVGSGQAWFLTADDGAVRVDRREPGRSR